MKSHACIHLVINAARVPTQMFWSKTPALNHWCKHVFSCFYFLWGMWTVMGKQRALACFSCCMSVSWAHVTCQPLCPALGVEMKRWLLSLEASWWREGARCLNFFLFVLLKDNCFTEFVVFCKTSAWISHKKERIMTNLDSIFKSRDITLPTKVHLVKAMVFPVVMYGWMWELDCEEG